MSAKEELQDPYDIENHELSENGITSNKPSENASEETDKNKLERRVTVNELPRSTTIDSAVVRSFLKVDEPKEVESDHHSCCTCWKLPAVRIWVERIVLFSICVAVAGAFIVPIIIYAVDADRGSNNPSILTDIDLDNCQDESTLVSQLTIGC